MGKRKARVVETPSRQHATPITRTQAVWGLLVMAMTGVGGCLWMLDTNGPSPRLDGLALASIERTGRPPSITEIFKTREPIERSRWKAIVIHHSGTPSGTPEMLAARAGGPSFHFVIGNGRGMDDGGLYVDHRWLLQEATSHSRGRSQDGERGWYDQNAISICLVGDGEHGTFSETQINRLKELVQVLTRRMGLGADDVRLSSDVYADRGPGRLFPGAEFHEWLASLPQ